MNNPRFNFLATLQTRFLWALVLIGLVPLSIVGLILLNQERNALEAQAARELVGLSRGLAEELDTLLDETLKAPRALASLPEIVSMDPKRQLPILRDMYIELNNYGQIAVADLDGQLLVTGREQPLVSIAHIASFQQAAKGEQGWVIAPGLYSDQLVLHMHTPIRNEQREIVGVLGSPVPLPSLATALQRLGEGGGQAFVLDETGKVLVHPDPATMNLRPSYAQWVNLPGGGLPASVGIAHYEVDGTAYIAGFAPLPDFGWTIVVERPTAEILAPAVRSLNWTIAGLVVSGLLSMLVALFLARGLTRPVRNLAAATKALGAGDPNAPLPAIAGATREIGALVAAFSAMREAVSEREASLHRTITELERAEAEIRKHLLAMSASIDGMGILENETYIYANEALARLHGYEDGKQLIGKAWYTLYALEERNRLAREVMPRVFRTGLWRGEAIGKRQDGTTFPQEVSLAQVETGALVLVVRDLTERKQAEEALRRAQKMESLGVLAGGIAHDFNNLLTSMMGHISLAKAKQSRDEPAYVHMEKALKSTQRAADLTRQLLTYAGKGQSHMEVFNLNELIRENAGLLETVIPRKVDLVLQLSPGLPPIKADRGQIHQVIMNLVINAAEAIKGAESGRVVLRTSTLQMPLETNLEGRCICGQGLPPGCYAHLDVSDTGVGMDAHILDRIFDPFFSTKPQGSGLGLSATLGIIQAHQGGLNVYSRPGEGSTFSVCFPISEQPLDADEAGAQQNGRMYGTILVVDDEQPIRELAQDALEMLGLTVLTAVNGRDGLETFRTHRTEIMVTVLDMKMPVMSGDEVLKHIHEIEPNARVVLSSGYAEVEAADLLAGAEFVSFLQKPYTADGLIAKVQEISMRIGTNGAIAHQPDNRIRSS